MFQFDPMTLRLAALSWAVPMALSMLLFDPATKQPTVPLLWFKAIMALALAAATAYGFIRLRGAGRLSLPSAHTFVAVNIVLDLIVLIGLLRMAPAVWLNTVVPVYPLVIYGLNMWLRR